MPMSDAPRSERRRRPGRRPQTRADRQGRRARPGAPAAIAAAAGSANRADDGAIARLEFGPTPVCGGGGHRGACRWTRLLPTGGRRPETGTLAPLPGSLVSRRNGLLAGAGRRALPQASPAAPKTPPLIRAPGIALPPELPRRPFPPNSVRKAPPDQPKSQTWRATSDPEEGQIGAPPQKNAEKSFGNRSDLKRNLKFFAKNHSAVKKRAGSCCAPLTAAALKPGGDRLRGSRPEPGRPASANGTGEVETTGSHPPAATNTP